MPRIMIVDDDPATLRSLRQIPEEEGHTVDEAPDGQVALRHFAGNPADLVICDVYMPNMNGIEFVIRVREAFPEAKIVGLSGGGFLSKGSVRHLPTGCRYFRTSIQCLPMRPVP